MNILIFDVETTTSNKGNPFDLTNRLCTLGALQINDGVEIYTDFDFINKPFWLQEKLFQTMINEADLIIGFNIKFDLHWIRRYGFDFEGKRVYDVQLAEFLLSNQTYSYPSLDGVCEIYRLGKKLDIVKTQYWDCGIDTDEVPTDILFEYQQQDIRLTYECYKVQQKLLEESGKLTLLKMQCMDLLVLQEMEFNGIYFNTKDSIQFGNDTKESIVRIVSQLNSFTNNVPVNWSSNDHLSAILYGGVIKEDYQEPIGVYKTGARAGEVKMKWYVRIHEFPRLVEPLKGSEGSVTSKLSDEEVKVGKGCRIYATNEPTLRTLKPSKKARELINLILEQSKLEKIVSTYYHGLPSLMQKMNWKPDYIHGQFNQVVAVTGRLSSSKPNLQNFDTAIDVLFISRF